MVHDKLITDGTSYGIDNLNNVPSNIDIASSCEKSNAATIAFFGPHSVFSNMHAYGFEKDGVYCNSSEHYIQAKKAELFDDDVSKTKILGTSSPFEAKQLGSHVKKL